MRGLAVEARGGAYPQFGGHEEVAGCRMAKLSLRCSFAVQEEASLRKIKKSCALYRDAFSRSESVDRLLLQVLSPGTTSRKADDRDPNQGFNKKDGRILKREENFQNTSTGDNVTCDVT